MYYLVSAALMPALASVFARLGTRPVVTTGTLAIGWSVMSLTWVDQPSQLFAAYLVMALGWAAMSMAAIPLLVAPWFVRRRGWALSLALNGASAGGIIVVPTLLWLICRWGFERAVLFGVGD